jgi:DNA-binding MarR family transcriptional regulator
VTATYGQIAEKLEISPRTAVNAVNSLIAHGLVTRGYVRTHGRIAALKLTIHVPQSRNWVWVECRLFELHLSPAQIHVYLAIKCRSNHAGRAWPSLTQLSEDTGLSRKTVAAAVKALTACCLLRKQKRQRVCGCAGNNNYYVVGCDEREDVMRVMRKKKARTRGQLLWHRQTKKGFKVPNVRSGYYRRCRLSRHPHALFFCAVRWCKKCNPYIDPPKLRQYKRKNRLTFRKKHKSGHLRA